MRTIPVYDVKRLGEMRAELLDIAEREAMKLFRLARRCVAHGVSANIISDIRNEAFELHTTGYPERLLDPCKTWKYAFR